jgi:UDP-glucose 4-epimerase
MKCLVTGGAGFIGSHIVDRLVKDGHTVTVIDNESSEANEQFFYNDSVEYYKLNIIDYAATRHLYNGVNFVFHLAAESRIQPTLLNPLGAIQTNTVGTTTVLQCAREAEVEKVIYSSTSSAYGLRNIPPLHEDMIDDCLNPYSVSKMAGEQMCKIYTTLYGLKTVTFRYFNVYGDREPTKGPYAPVVGLFLRQLAANEPLTIVSDGTQRRDFVHVNDVVEANILAMTVDQEHYGEVFNVGTGKTFSVLELAEMISGTIKMVAPRKGEAYITQANIDKIRRVLGWSPKKYVNDYIKEKLKKD